MEVEDEEEEEGEGPGPAPLEGAASPPWVPQPRGPPRQAPSASPSHHPPRWALPRPDSAASSLLAAPASKRKHSPQPLSQLQQQQTQAVAVAGTGGDVDDCEEEAGEEEEGDEPGWAATSYGGVGEGFGASAAVYGSGGGGGGSAAKLPRLREALAEEREAVERLDARLKGCLDMVRPGSLRREWEGQEDGKLRKYIRRRARHPPALKHFFKLPPPPCHPFKPLFPFSFAFQVRRRRRHLRIRHRRAWLPGRIRRAAATSGHRCGPGTNPAAHRARPRKGWSACPRARH